MTENDATVAVRMYSTRQAAEFNQMLLEGSGIMSFIQGDDCGGMRPFMAPVTGVRLIVRSTDRERADDVLKDSEQKSAEPETGGYRR